LNKIVLEFDAKYLKTKIKIEVSESGDPNYKFKASDKWLNSSTKRKRISKQRKAKLLKNFLLKFVIFIGGQKMSITSPLL